MEEMSGDNKRLINEFGAESINSLKHIPDFYTFKKGLMYSHRDFDTFYKSLLAGKKAAIVSGFNPSATIHLGHIPVFDTNLFFQRQYGVEIFVPLSDDESYVTQKVNTQEEGLKYALTLVRSLLAYGYDKRKTHMIIDQLYTNIYNLAIKLSRGITMSEIKAVFGYTNDQNTGLHFYPAIQSAHVLLPETMGMRNVLVPIGPDEDSHLRVCRDIAEKFGFEKPAVLHSLFMPGIDGTKMSKSKNNGIFMLDDNATIKKKVFSAFSGGRESVEAHRKYGGNPDVDIAYIYLKYYFLDEKEADEIAEQYRSGKLLSGELKQMLYEHILKRIDEFKEKYAKVSEKDIADAIMRNEDVDIERIIEKLGILK